MPSFLANLSARLIAMIVGGLLILGLILLTLHECSKRRSEAAQARVNASQAQAQSDSAADAINAAASSDRAAAASEDLTRDNSRDIHNAPGASDRVNSGVDLAGRKALCRRKAYANDPKCAIFRRSN